MLRGSTLYPRRLLLPLLVILFACDGEEKLPADPGTQSSGPQRVAGAPPGWFRAGDGAQFEVGRDYTQFRTGTAAAYLTSTSPSPEGFTTLMQQVKADGYRGRRVRWKGWVRHADLGGDGAGLWMRVDGPGTQLAFDNMGLRYLLGTSDWHEVAVVLDVPQSALGIALGVLLSGPGDLLVDDLRLEIVDDTVPSTDLLSAPEPMSSDSAEVAATYARTPVTPRNTSFEGASAWRSSTVAWLAAHASPFTTTVPGADDGDLEPLRALVGQARVVGVGEGTHGTREFFENKDRFLRFLVRQMGFAYFAIEATSPESDAVNRYVLGGEGDPAKLLSNLYFWTWNTREVRDLIDWMREWNLGAPPERRVRFLGFDMQSPGVSIDSIVAIVDRVRAADTAPVAGRLACIQPYGNDGPRSLRPIGDYAALPDSTRAACRKGLEQVDERIRSEAVYATALSDSAYQQLLHYVRLVQQYEAAASVYDEPNGYYRARDASMAENVLWLLDRAPVGSRMMLWAHNYHVSRLAGAMGDSLDSALGSDYLAIGQIFGIGAFNAIEGTEGRLRPWYVTFRPEDALESLFFSTGAPLLLFDARQVMPDDTASAPLASPILVRSIGASFDPEAQARYFVPQLLPEDFDAMIWVRETTASQLLRFVY